MLMDKFARLWRVVCKVLNEELHSEPIREELASDLAAGAENESSAQMHCFTLDVNSPKWQ